MTDDPQPKRTYAQNLAQSAFGLGSVKDRHGAREELPQDNSQKDSEQPYTVEYDEKGVPNIIFSLKERERIQR